MSTRSEILISRVFKFIYFFSTRCLRLILVAIGFELGGIIGTEQVLEANDVVSQL